MIVYIGDLRLIDDGSDTGDFEELREELRRSCYYCGKKPSRDTPNYSVELNEVDQVTRMSDGAPVPLGSLPAARAIVRLARARLVDRVTCSDEKCGRKFALDQRRASRRLGVEF